jgi:acyl-coenzyme A thioesterase PaaI-like protein
MIPEGHQQRLSGDARLELAALCRRVIDELASSTADSAAFASAGALLRDAVEVLAAATHGRPYAEAEASMAGYQQHLFIDHSPFSGWLNPLAPPMTLTSDGTEVLGTVTFGAAYEGPPGHVHGGYVAAAFDEVLGFAQGLSGKPGMTAHLGVDYKSPTPLYQPLRFRGDIERIDGRKIYARGELRVEADDRLCATATGLFVSMKTDTFDRLMKIRNG